MAGNSNPERDARLVLVCALVIFGYFFAHPDQNHNVHSRWNLVRSIVEDHTLSIDRFHENTEDKAKVRGRHYSDKAPGTALAGAPIYALLRGIYQAAGWTLHDDVAREIVRYGVVSAPSAIIVWLLYLAIRAAGCGSFWSAALVLAYAVGTPALAYATLLYGHQTVAFLALASVWIVVPPPAILGPAPARSKGPRQPAKRSRTTTPLQTKTAGSSSVTVPNESVVASSSYRTPLRLLLSGFCVGLGVLTEYPIVLVGVLLGGYLLAVLRPRWHIVYFLLGGVPAALCLMTYNWLVFQDPFAIGYNFEVDQRFKEEMAAGFASATYPKLEAMWFIAFSLSRGLFAYSPFLLLAIPGFFIGLRADLRHARLWLSGLIALTLFLFVASIDKPHGGWACGPRYLVPAIPFMIYAVAPALHLGPALWLRPIFAGLAVVSVAKLLLATAVDPHVPEVFVNPLVDFWWPMGQEGYSSINLGTLAGLSPIGSAIPLVALVAVALWIIARRELQTGSDEPARPTDAPAASSIAVQFGLFGLAAVLAVIPNFFASDDDSILAHLRISLLEKNGLEDGLVMEYQRLASGTRKTKQELDHRRGAHYWLGLRAYNRKEFEAAAEYFHAGTTQFPESAPMWNGEGAALHALGESESAIECFKNALRVDPQNEMARQGLELLQQRQP